MLELKDITFSYDSKPVISGFDLHVERGEIHCLLGSSGSGKSTLLHLISGFLEPSEGTILLNSKCLISRGNNCFVPPEKRGMAIVFQEHCLFPHLTVQENIEYGMPDSFGTEEKLQSAQKLLSMVHLEDKKDKFPQELSGGEQQRVSIIRALASKPEVLLMDEPFSALDTSLRDSLRREVKNICKELDITVVLVTHSLEEALILGDRITMLNNKGEFQTGSKEDILERPQFSEVMELTKSGVVIGSTQFEAQNFIPFSRLHFGDDKSVLTAEVLDVLPLSLGNRYFLKADNCFPQEFTLDINQKDLILNVGNKVSFSRQ